MNDVATPVKVAVRIRPLVSKEISEGACQFISKVPHLPQVTVKGSSQIFTCDHVFGPDDSKTQVYDTVSEKVDKVLEGYNATILACGLTGSGKTFLMGTAGTASPRNSGIIQQAVKDLFLKIGEPTSLSFEIKVSFLEVISTF